MLQEGRGRRGGSRAYPATLRVATLGSSCLKERTVARVRGGREGPEGGGPGGSVGYY